MMSVRAKKHLGQHFLKDEHIAQKIADTLTLKNYNYLLEIGPGMGVLTKYLLKKEIEVRVIEIDRESVDYLKLHYPQLSDKIIASDFLRTELSTLFDEKPFAIIGNFPYNISSQIVFKAIE
ncbi:MAG: 16S rRNA (adenine(1518)-N(6)/adenine(1519)-N(6))-dimethyltransferase, partial [Flavobacteriaceae bacterium]|nr:16S rRNA (adenine(1518)-N(6)/adenine(1519)-N(6))-dimethyltransferase [Flavobacteriaceae bacterium]